MGDNKKVAALCCAIVLTTSLAATASIKQFSSGLVPTQEPIKTEFQGPSQVYKVKVSQGKIPELKSAILWHAPPYKSLSSNLNANEQILIDEEAMQVLINGATEINEDLLEAKNLVSKKEPLLFKIRQLMMSRDSEAEDSSSLSNLIFNGKSKNDALSLINKVSAYIYHNYEGFKAFYHASYNREAKLIAQHKDTKAKLELISGSNAVAKVEALLNGGRV